MRYLYRAGIFTLSGTVLGLIILLALLLYSPKFNHWLVLKLTTLVPELSIVKADGLLLSEMHLQGLKYRVEQADISIESASYRLNLKDFLAKKIQFEYLHVRHVDVVLLESSPAKEQDNEAITFVMPVKLELDDFTLKGLQVQQNETRYLIESINLALLYQGQQLQIKQFSLNSDMIQLQGEAGLQLEPRLPFNVDLLVAKSVPDTTDIKARLQLQGDTQKINLTADIQAPSEAHAQGSINLNEEESPRFDLSCVWPILQWPLQGDKLYASENARLTLQGTAEDYSISLDTDIFAKDIIATGKLHLVGAGDTEKFTLKTLKIKALGGGIQSKGRISWTDNIPSQLQLLAKNIQLSSISAGYSGELNLDAQLAGRLFNKPDFRIELNKLDGKVLDKPLNAKAKIHYSPKQLLIEQLEANVGDNSLVVQGAIGVRNYIDFTLDAADLHELSSDLYGSAYAQGDLQGSASSPVVQFKLQSDGLKFQQQKLGSLRANGRLTTAGEGQLDLVVKARQLVYNEMKINKLELQSSGQFAQHNFKALVDSQQGKFEVAMQGSWDPAAKDWQGQIQQLKVQSTSAGIWQLIQAAPLEMKFAEQESMQLQTDLCLTRRANTGLLCLTAKMNPQQGQMFSGNIKHLPLSVFAAWMPETLQVDSYLQATFSLQNPSDLQGDIHMSLDPGSVRVDQDLSGVQIVSFKAVQFDAKLFPDSLQSTVSVVLNDANHIKGQIDVSGLEQRETANIDGLLKVQLEDISFLGAFIDSVSDLAGEVNGQLVLQGLLSAPQLNGSKVRLAQGKLSVPEIGLQVHDINIELKHSKQQQLALHGKAKLAEQKVVINGWVDQYIDDQFKFKMAIKGDDLQVMQTPEMQIWISPDLHLIGDKRGAKLEGEVSIPKAELIFESLPEGAVALSDDEVIITDKKRESKAPAYSLDADIKIRLGEAVSIEGFGLKTHLQGQLHAVQKNNQLKLFNELRSVKGTYQAYGQDLTIEKGQLLFSGELDNPGVNILASRKASDWEDKTIAYLRMTGTLKKPVTTVYTEPALNESEALAYLLTGAPLGKSGSSNAALLAAAAMSLGRDYIDAMMGVVGIDEFDMKSTSVGQNSMVIGKRISSDLYARYIMDVLTAQMQFAVVYKLTKNISIETRAGSTHSSDIKYNIEFD